MEDAAQSIANLRAWHKKHVDVRNTIAHHTCAGSWKTDPSMIVFAPVRAKQGVLNHVEIEHIPLSHMIAATDFASKAADILMVAVETLHRATQYNLQNLRRSDLRIPPTLKRMASKGSLQSGKT